MHTLNQTEKYKTIILISLIFIITLAAFWPVLKCGFVGWDDNLYVTANPVIQTLSFNNIKTIFTSTHLFNYHPLPLFTYALEFHFFKFNPFIYHLNNLLLHLGNTLLVFWLIWLLTKNHFLSFIVALLFGIHPLHVEPAAWVSGRRDVLYSFFFLGSLISYLYYTRTRLYKYRYLSLILFVFAFISKAIVITLPFILLLFDYKLQGKLDKNNFKDKISFFAISVLLGALTVSIRIGLGDMDPVTFFNFNYNMPIAGFGLLFYLYKILLPVKLSCVYPYYYFNRSVFLEHPAILFFSPAILAALAALVFFSRYHTKKVIFGALFFILTILPVIQFYPSFTATSLFADRYLYIPSIGLFFIFAEGLLWLYTKKTKYRRLMRFLLFLFLVVLIVILSCLTWKKCCDWKDTFSLWNEVIKNYPEVAIAYVARGGAYLEEGDCDRAVSDFNKSLEIDPMFDGAYTNRGNAYSDKGDFEQAIADYNKAIEINPNDYKAYNNRGNICSRQGDLTQAISDYDKSIEINPSDAYVYYNRGNIYLSKGNLKQAAADYSSALEINPNYTEAYSVRGDIYLGQGACDRAIADYTKAIKINPQSAIIYSNRGNAYKAEGNLTQAIADYDQALKIDPNLAATRYERGEAYQEKGAFDQAIADYNKVLEITSEPDNVQGYTADNKGNINKPVSGYNKASENNIKLATAYYSRGLAYQGKGNFKQAIADYSRALEINPRLAEGYDNRGLIYSSQGNFAQAIADYTKAIKINPDYAEAYNNRGNAYQGKNNLTRAVSDYNKALEINSSYISAYNNRAVAYFRTRKYNRAWEDVCKVELLGGKAAPGFINDLQKAQMNSARADGKARINTDMEKHK